MNINKEQLILKYLNNQCSETELEIISELFKDVANEKELSEIFGRALKKTESHLEMTQEHNMEIWNRIKSETKPDFKHKPSGSRKFHTYSWFRIAASLLLLSGITYLFVNNFVGSEYEKVTSTDITVQSFLGNKKLLTLPDGSLAYMNSGTKITYPTAFNENMRKIELVGEAFFEIVEDENRPFIIETSSVSTKVLGTSFNLSSYENEPFELTLVTGKVEVSSNQEKDIMTLFPNEQVLYNTDMGLFNKQKVDTKPFTAWKEGNLVLKGSLSDVTKKIERWYNKKIVIKNKALEKCIIDASYKNQYLDNVLQGLAFLLDLEYTIEGDTIILDGNGC
ncbi:FecR domain-containing protein [Fulvivirgaceae bacterium BMA10]|uniref:FecR domain-containing protein n=1 Tax=Splendidivirga corallicola TaxID=3051826 RepID=A0ABT8KN78_9BACT|nr:FecR domain-containing protein [Fulvivirgaceae bacterium BMA10]